MNEDLTPKQIRELQSDAPYNFVILQEDYYPHTWEETGNPVIYGDIFEAANNFLPGSDSTIVSVEEFCKRRNLRIEDVMEYID